MRNKMSREHRGSVKNGEKPKRTKVVTRGTKLDDGTTSVRKKKVVTRRDGTVKNVGKAKDYKSADESWANRTRGERPTSKYKWKAKTDSEGKTMKTVVKVKEDTYISSNKYAEQSDRSKRKFVGKETSSKNKRKGGSALKGQTDGKKGNVKKNKIKNEVETKKTIRPTTRKIYK